MLNINEARSHVIIHYHWTKKPLPAWDTNITTTSYTSSTAVQQKVIKPILVDQKAIVCIGKI